MRVTDLDYVLENKLVEKLDLMVERVEKLKKDVVANIEGAEGEGKTNTSCACAYYVKDKTKRPINMFFRLDGLMEFAKKTEEQIIIWDEPALDSLSTDWYKEVSKDLIRLLMTCRKKKHFFFFNFVKFFKFPEYIIVDRGICLIHMYTRKNIIPGRFVYIKQENLEDLFNDYKSKKRRNYKKYMKFGGVMPMIEHLFEQMDITIEGKEHCTMADYERLKDEAIESIGKEKEKANPHKKRLHILENQIGNLEYPVANASDMSRKLKRSRATLFNWKNNNKNTEENGTV